MKESNEYILGTHPDELHRLGIQHQVWASEAQTGWANAGFTAGHHLLDLGSGPGFCSRELAYIVGSEGTVVAVDQSQNYIKEVNHLSEKYQLPLRGVCSTFEDLELEPNTLDGVYCRWALAWNKNPQAIIEKITRWLKPGSKFIAHEYFHWMTHSTVPEYSNLNIAIKAAFDSFESFGGTINVGRQIPEMAVKCGLSVELVRPMAKMAQPKDFTWQWPGSFYKVYFPKLVEDGFLDPDFAQKALAEFEALSSNPNSMLHCPLVAEIIVTKPN